MVVSRTELSRKRETWHRPGGVSGTEAKFRSRIDRLCRFVVKKKETFKWRVGWAKRMQFERTAWLLDNSTVSQNEISHAERNVV